MNAAPSISQHRQRVLHALGITAWALRAGDAQKIASKGASKAMPTLIEATAARCVVLLPAGCTPRELDLLGRALCTFGPGLARAARIEVTHGSLVSVPVAQAYLVFGEAQAQALGRELTAERQRQAHIVLADLPDRVLADAGSKRRLWHALRQLRCMLNASDSLAGNAPIDN